MEREEKWKVKLNEKEIIKYLINHEICEPNLKFVEVNFFEFFYQILVKNWNGKLTTNTLIDQTLR